MSASEQPAPQCSVPETMLCQKGCPPFFIALMSMPDMFVLFVLDRDRGPARPIVQYAQMAKRPAQSTWIWPHVTHHCHGCGCRQAMSMATNRQEANPSDTNNHDNGCNHAGNVSLKDSPKNRPVRSDKYRDIPLRPSGMVVREVDAA